MAFVNLVEALLEQFVADLDMTAEDFCALVGRSGAENRDRLLQAIDGVTDFDVFLSMVHDAKESGCL
eukprot:6576771-Prymnesium_polylepis.1